MSKKVFALFLLTVLLLVPAALAGATGSDDPVSSEPEEEGEAEPPAEQAAEDEAEPTGGEEPAIEEEAPDYVQPDAEGEMGITSVQGEDGDLAGDPEMVRALYDDGTAPGNYTWVYCGAGAAALLAGGAFFISRRKAKG